MFNKKIDSNKVKIGMSNVECDNFKQIAVREFTEETINKLQDALNTVAYVHQSVHVIKNSIESGESIKLDKKSEDNLRLCLVNAARTVNTIKELLDFYTSIHRIILDNIDSADKLKYENGRLKNENVELKNENVELKNENVELKNENVELKNENVELNGMHVLLRNKNKRLEKENNSLKEENDIIKNKNERLEKDNNNLRVNNEKLMENIEYAKEMKEKLNKFMDMDLINKNIEIISNIKEKISIIEENSSSSDDENKDIIEIKNTIENIDKKTENLVKLNPFMDRMKKVSEQAKSGEKSNRFIEELDTEELIRVYRENGCSIPKNVFEHYKLKYGITYNGLRNRLINAGVWKFR